MNNAAISGPIADSRRIGSLLDTPMGGFAYRRSHGSPDGSSDREALRAAFGTRSWRLLRRGDHVYLQGETCGFLHMIHSGSVKSFVTTRGGNEHVLGFHLPGEVIGVDGMSCAQYNSSTIALEHTTVSTLALGRLRVSGTDQQPLAGCVISILAGEVRRERALRLLRNHLDAEHRLCGFLLDWSGRLGELGYSPTGFQLPMSRLELGSYLGVTQETLCRLFAALRAQGLVRATRRCVEIVALNRLRERVESTLPA